MNGFIAQAFFKKQAEEHKGIRGNNNKKLAMK